MEVERENWQQLAAEVGMYGIFDNDLESLLTRMTSTTNDDDIVNTLAEQLGFPPDISGLLHKLKVSFASFSLSDGQTSFTLEIDSKGLAYFFQALIRFLATME